MEKSHFYANFDICRLDMILSFKVKNYLSFRDENALNLIADALKEHVDYTHIPLKFDNKLRVLKSVAIYGHNSHGKSNFLKAFDFFQNFINLSLQLGVSDGIIPIENFKLQTLASKSPSSFELTFIVEEIKFRYGFQVTKQNVIEEWLFYSLPKVRENNLFIRKEQEIKVSKTWNKETLGRIEQAIFFAKPKVLFLSVLLQQTDLLYTDKIGKWLRNNKVILDINDKKLLSDSALVYSDPEYQRLINIFLKAANLGFTTVEEKIDQLSRNNQKISKDLLKLANYKEIENFELYTKHEIFDETFKLKDFIYFDMLKNESAGTQKYFVLISLICYAIKNGQILWIDEIDSRFHTLLLQLIVSLYNSKKINVSGSQMIFTSHNTSLLNKRLRRDQVIFVEKDKYGASSIFRMHSSKNPIRIDSSLEKDYLNGNLKGIGLFTLSKDNQWEINFDM